MSDAAAPCLGCQRLELPDAPTVELAAGGTVCTYCEAWRLECFERHNLVLRILAMPERERRRAAVEACGRDKGPLARERLEAAVRAEWQRRRDAAAAEAASA